MGGGLGGRGEGSEGKPLVGSEEQSRDSEGPERGLEKPCVSSSERLQVASF